MSIAKAVRQSGLHTKVLRAAAFEHLEGDVNLTREFADEYYHECSNTAFMWKNLSIIAYAKPSVCGDAFSNISGSISKS